MMSASDVAGRPLIVPALGGIPETLLWTLHARAGEARRTGGFLKDPEAERIRAAIDYDFDGRFGPPNPLFALRAALIDGVLVRWLRRHPEGLVASLGEGLETQRFRVDNGRMRWLSVDLPDAIQLRERFIPPGDRFQHLAASATDEAWMDRAVGTPDLCVVAQGLFMYLDPDEVRRLLLAIARRFPGAEVIFDVVPQVVSDSTRRGHHQSETYVLPPMPWGLDRNEIVPTLQAWKLNVRWLRFLPYRTHRRRHALIEALLDRVVPARQRLPSLVHLKL